jgi:hypothetical protein
MAQNGLARWQDIDAALSMKQACPKLETYWQFHGCQYQKGARTCAEPEHIEACPLPLLPLRNGSLNRLAYSLFLFIRDVAQGDLVGWMDRQLATANQGPATQRLGIMGEALMRPLRNVHGLSDKVLNMTLATLLLGAGRGKTRWLETGANLIAVDSLVHNFLARSGILKRSHAVHAYGPKCYKTGGCADLVRLLSGAIDARQFNPKFPANFPRLVQSAIWRYCAADVLDVCNGNKIDDRASCQNTACRVFSLCDRESLDGNEAMPH